MTEKFSPLPAEIAEKIKDSSTPTTHPTMKDVAMKAGVSITTVSHALNETRHVADETSKRIHEALQETAYTPNAAGRNMGRSVEEGSKHKGKLTMDEVAKRAGVSITTVSHVLNGTRPVAFETRERVLKEVATLGYTINPDAQALRKR